MVPFGLYPKNFNLFQSIFGLEAEQKPLLETTAIDTLTEIDLSNLIKPQPVGIRIVRRGRGTEG